MPPGSPAQVRPNPEIPSLWTRLLFTSKLKELYRRVADAEGIFQAILDEMEVRLQVSEADIAKIPASGATVVVSNHPFGILDGAAAAALLLRVRPDVKILTNDLLSALPEFSKYCIWVDPFARKGSKEANSRGLKQAIAHLRAGGMLVIFPAGEVSHFQVKRRQVIDPEWNDTAVRLMRKTGAKALPILFRGRNSLGFHVAGMIHPLLRTASLPRELFKKVGQSIEVRVGAPVCTDKISSFSSDTEALNYLRWRTYLLADRTSEASDKAPKFPAITAPKLLPLPLPIVKHKKVEEIAPETPVELLEPEIDSLSDQVLDENREFQVVYATSAQIPATLREIGRLREMTFRAVGEGTGRPLDVDRFDAYYTHLVLWNKRDRRVAGAYRLANTQEVLSQYGVQGLYTATLFEYAPDFFERIGPALEMGRSFVRQEYQKQFAPLLMLWRAIARYVSRNPETPILFGAVSISSEYSAISQGMMVRYFHSRRHNDLARLVRPRRGFQSKKVAQLEFSTINQMLDHDEISECIAEIERDGKGLPILLKQYLKLGGTILDFNVDREFSNVLDGLILVDLRRTEPSRLEPYMGKEGSRRFFAYHANLDSPVQVH